MTKDQAEIKAKNHLHLIGQKWRHNISGTIEIVTEVKPISVPNTNEWVVTISFIPLIETFYGQLSEPFLDSFLNDYTKLK